jgi:dihydrofolate reductase
MPKVVVMMSVSLDGYFAGPAGELDWHDITVELHEYFNAYLSEAGAFLEGRVTWQLMAEFWPTADEDPDASETVKEFAAIWRNIPKVVYSRTLESAGWKTSIVREIVPADIEAMKAEPGGDLFVGGSEIVNEYRRHGLIDEYRIYVMPIILGAGKPLFHPSDEPENLGLVEAKTFENGVVMLRYEVAR